MRPSRTDRQALVGALQRAGAVFPSGPASSSFICPFHGEKRASGSVFSGDDGHWRFKCHGCETKGDVWDVEARMWFQSVEEWLAENPESDSDVDRVLLDTNLEQPKQESLAPANPTPPAHRTQSWPTMAALATSLASAAGGEVETTYAYHIPGVSTGILHVIRIALPGVDATGKREKTIRQCHHDGEGWIAKAPPKPWPLYRLPDIQAVDAVVVVEGEKACEALWAVGVPASTTACGAGNAESSDLSPLQGKRVWLWPDNDPKGLEHMRDVADKLQALPKTPEITVLDPKAMPVVMPPKGDAVEFLEAIPGDAEAKRTAVMSLLRAASGSGAVDDLARRLEAQIAGEFALVPFPWPLITKATQALLPGTVTLLCGGPGAAKSFLEQQIALFAHCHGHPVALLELEDQHAYYQQRILAMLAGNAKLMDPAWCKEYPDAVRAALQMYQDKISAFCPRLTAKGNMTLVDVVAWVTHACSAGNRIIIVDPITLADPGELKPWEADRYLLSEVKPVIERSGASLILVTHPRKSPGATSKTVRPSLDDLAGGAMYQRAAHCVLWLQNNDKADGTIQTKDGEVHVAYNKIITVLKARNGGGTGTRIAFNFSGTALQFQEIGIIPRPSTASAVPTTSATAAAQAAVRPSTPGELMHAWSEHNKTDTSASTN